MNLQQILDELKNVKEQAMNDDDITKDSIIEAITDIIHDVEGNDGMDLTMEYDDEFEESFESVDFTQLEI